MRVREVEPSSDSSTQRNKRSVHDSSSSAEPHNLPISRDKGEGGVILREQVRGGDEEYQTF